jgi:LPS-assembly lipoprotein
MLSSKLKAKTPRALTMALFLGLGLTLSACQVRPLYSTSTTSGQNLSSDLASIEIAPARDRVEQEIRNNLIFAFTGGGYAGDPVYRLEILVKNTASDLEIESGTGLAKTTRVILNVTYKLTHIAENRIVTTGSSFFTASYAKSEQRFSNDRALRDAENRAANQVAEDIKLRLSAFFATGH